MATKMESKFDKYWGKVDKINHLLYVVVILDPRKKLTFLKFFFFEIYGNEVADEMVELVKDSLVKLYDYYSCVDSPNVQVPSGSERIHIEGESIGCRDPYAMCWLYLFLLLLLSQCLALEDAYLIHFGVRSLHSWFKILFVHKIGFKPWFQFFFANQRMS